MRHLLLIIALCLGAIGAAAQAAPEVDMVIANATVDHYIITPGIKCMFDCTLYNKGTKYVSRCNIGVFLDDTQIAIVPVDKVANSAADSYVLKAFLVPDELTRGAHTFTFRVMDVEGVVPTVNTADDATTVSVSAVLQADIVARNLYLIEQLTSTSCTFCPTGSKLLDAMLQANPDMTLVCAHGDMTPTSLDPYSCTASSNLIGLLGATGYPSAAFNRINVSGEGLSDMNLIFNASQQAKVAAEYASIMREYADPCVTSIDVEATLSADQKTISIRVSGKGGPYTRELLAGCGLTVYVVENGLVARQLDMGQWREVYVHNNVLRATPTLYNGSTIAYLSESEFANTYNVKVDPAWRTDKLEVVAFVNRKGRDIDHKCVINCNRCAVVPAEAAGIDVPLAPAAPTQAHDLSGRAVSPATHGITIEAGRKTIR